MPAGYFDVLSMNAIASAVCCGVSEPGALPPGGGPAVEFDPAEVATGYIGDAVVLG